VDAAVAARPGSSASAGDGETAGGEGVSAAGAGAWAAVQPARNRNTAKKKRA